MPQPRPGPCADRHTVAVVGPTASGKSALALELALRLDGEIVNADAFALYRGMDVGTAKPGLAERARVPHHCFDLLTVSAPASVAEYQRVARAAVADVCARGRLPVVVGGSALYARALCDVLDIPPRDHALRQRLQCEAEQHGAQALHRRLAAADPEAARHIDPRNVRRVVRALEVVELQGSFTARLPSPVGWCPTLWLAVRWPRADLDRRILARVEHMWAGDVLLAETRTLLATGLADAPTASRAVGYAEAIAVLEGSMTRVDAVASTVAATRRLARRQERAFRADDRVTWLEPDDAADRAEELVRQWLAEAGRQADRR